MNYHNHVKKYQCASFSVGKCFFLQRERKNKHLNYTGLDAYVLIKHISILWQITPHSTSFGPRIIQILNHYLLTVLLRMASFFFFERISFTCFPQWRILSKFLGIDPAPWKTKQTFRGPYKRNAVRAKTEKKVILHLVYNTLSAEVFLNNFFPLCIFSVFITRKPTGPMIIIYTYMICALQFVE